MLYYGRIDLSEGVEINKTNTSKQCDVCPYLQVFMFQPYAFNRCHNLLMIYMNLSNNGLLEKNNETWEKVSKSIKKNLIVNQYRMKSI